MGPQLLDAFPGDFDHDGLQMISGVDDDTVVCDGDVESTLWMMIFVVMRMMMMILMVTMAMKYWELLASLGTKGGHLDPPANGRAVIFLTG